MESIFHWISGLILSNMAIAWFALWVWVIRRQKSGQEHFFSPQRRLKLPIGLVDLLMAVTLWLIGQLIGVTITSAMTGEFDAKAMTVWQQTVMGWTVGGGVMVTTVLTLVFIYGRYQRLEAIGFGGGGRDFARDIWLGVLVFFGFVPLTFLIQSLVTLVWEYEHPTLDLIAVDSSWLTLLSAWWVAVIVAPISEEIIFRGLLQGWLSRLFVKNRSPELPLLGGWPNQSPASSSTDSQPIDSTTSPDGDSPWYVAQSWVPVVLSALLFGLVHYGQGPAPIPIFVFGLGLGMIYRQTGRLLPCIVAHFMLNCFSMTALSVETFYFPTPDSIPEEVIEPALGWVSHISGF